MRDLLFGESNVSSRGKLVIDTNAVFAYKNSDFTHSDKQINRKKWTTAPNSKLFCNAKVRSLSQTINFASFHFIIT